jgi:hypothetical protein
VCVCVYVFLICPVSYTSSLVVLDCDHPITIW